MQNCTLFMAYKQILHCNWKFFPEYITLVTVRRGGIEEKRGVKRSTRGSLVGEAPSGSKSSSPVTVLSSTSSRSSTPVPPTKRRRMWDAAPPQPAPPARPRRTLTWLTESLATTFYRFRKPKCFFFKKQIITLFLTFFLFFSYNKFFYHFFNQILKLKLK